MLGSKLNPPATIELRSDLGGGKTTLVKGLARGFGSLDRVASPTFTLNKIYKSKRGQIHHFDFYRLSEAGIVAEQLAESLNDQTVLTVVEWGDIVDDVLPTDRLTIEFKPSPNSKDERNIVVNYPETLTKLIKVVETSWAEGRP